VPQPPLLPLSRASGSAAGGKGKENTAVDKNESWLTGMFRLSFDKMLKLERRRNPQLIAKRSDVKGERVGMGVFAARRLEPGEFICCVLGELRREAGGAIKSHPLALDVSELDNAVRDCSYSLRMFRGTMASLINSGRSPRRRDTSNVDIVYHPHFLRYPELYQSLRIVPSGAMWMRCKSGGIEEGHELLAAYDWWKMPPLDSSSSV
jgi:hypothetical protein